MSRKSPALRLLPAAAAILIVLGCATAGGRSDSYKLSDAYFIEVRDNEDPEVMSYFFQLNDALKEGDYAGVIDAATRGIDTIPKYPELFSYFYAMRAYASITLYRLEAGVEDINNLARFDSTSSMIPGLWTYYYFSYAPFDPDPKAYYVKAKESLDQWRAARPRNTFELVFSDPARIAEMTRVIDDELKK